MKGALVKNIDSNRSFIVLESMTCGALLWRVRIEHVGQHYLVDFAPVEPSKPWVFEQCVIMTRWRAIGLKARPPSWAHGGRSTPRLALVATGKAMSILRFAASRGFPGLTMPFPTKVAHHIGLDRPAKTEKALLREMITKLCPDFSESAIEACLRDRGRARAPKDADSCSLLAKDMGVFEQVQGLIDECDRTDVREAVEKLVEAKQTRKNVAQERSAGRSQTSAVARVSSASAASSAGEARLPPKRQTVPKDLRTETQVQHLKPPVRG